MSWPEAVCIVAFCAMFVGIFWAMAWGDKED